MNNQKNAKKSWGINYLDEFRSNLARLTLVDFGMIQHITEEGKAYVRRFRLSDYGDDEYVEAEIASDTLLMPSGGQLCLLVYPASPIYSLLEQKIFKRAEAFAKDGVKCVPLVAFDNDKDKVAFYRPSEHDLSLHAVSWDLYFTDASILFSSDTVQLSLTDKNFSLDCGSGKWCAEVDEEGNWKQGSGYSYDVDNKKFNWKSLIKQNDDGSISVECAGEVGDDNESFGKSKVEMGTDGSVEIKAGVDKDGNFKSHVKISPSGEIEISSLDGGSPVAQVTVGSSGVVFNSTSNKLSLQNDSYSLAQAFNDLLTVLDSFQTAGSPANHTAVPGQFETLKTSLQQFLE